MVADKCLENIKKQNPPIYCNELVPQFCAKFQQEINDFCGMAHDPRYMPIPMLSPQGKCFCCCMGGRTAAVATEGQTYRHLADLVVGDTVLAAGAELWWEPRTVTAVGSVPAGRTLRARFRFTGGEERELQLPAIQLLLAGSQGTKLISVEHLKPRDLVRQADGAVATFVQAEEVHGASPVALVSLGDYTAGDPPDGHLLNVEGLVSADLSVSVATYLARDRRASPS